MTQADSTILIESAPKRASFSENNSHVHWLKVGANYFGRDASNNIIFPGEDVGLYGGILFLNNGKVLLRTAAGQKIKNRKRSVDNVFIYENETSLVLEYSSFKFQIIQEDEKFGLLIFL